MTTPTKLQRWLDLITFLVSRRLPVAVDRIMEGVPAYAEKWETGDETDRASARRMFERDKDELRELGIPLDTVPYTINYGMEQTEGYRIARRDFYLPYLRLASRAGEAGSGDGSDPEEDARRADPGDPEVTLAEDEAALALDALKRVAELPSFPLRREARSALRKLSFDLADADLPETPVLYPDDPEAAELTGRLRTLSDALLARKRVRFDYHAIYRGETSGRDVAAYGLFFQHGHWYLVGSDATRDGDLRVFRVDRMEELEPNSRKPKTPDYEIPGDFRVADHLDREAWELGDREEEEPVEALIRFHFPSSLQVARNGRGELVDQEPGGSDVRRFRVYQVGPFVRWLLTFRGEAEVIRPASLERRLAETAEKVVALHREGP